MRQYVTDVLFVKNVNWIISDLSYSWLSREKIKIGNPKGILLFKEQAFPAHFNAFCCENQTKKKIFRNVTQNSGVHCQIYVLSNANIHKCVWFLLMCLSNGVNLTIHKPFRILYYTFFPIFFHIGFIYVCVCTMRTCCCAKLIAIMILLCILIILLLLLFIYAKWYD